MAPGSASAGSVWPPGALGLQAAGRRGAIQRLVNSTWHSRAYGKHSCTEFFVLVSRETESGSVLQSPKAELRLPEPQLESTPGLRHACHQALERLRNELAQTWSSFLKTWVYSLIPKGKHGTVTMEKRGHLLLNQGLEVMRALRREPHHHHAPLLWSFLPQMHNQNLTKREMSTSSENPRPGRGGEGVGGRQHLFYRTAGSVHLKSM